HTSTCSCYAASHRFPLFLCERRVLLLFLIFLLHLPYPRRASTQSASKTHGADAWQKSSPEYSPSSRLQGIQRTCRVFHARILRQMATIKRKKRQPFSLGRGVL